MCRSDTKSPASDLGFVINLFFDALPPWLAHRKLLGEVNMEVRRNLLLLGLLLVAGCEQAPNVCEGQGITQGVIRAVNANTRDAMPLVKNLQLQSVQVVSGATDQDVTVCSAQIVIPSEFSTLRKHIEYRVRAAMPDAENVFMSFSPDPSMEDFYTDVQTLSENVFGKSG